MLRSPPNDQAEKNLTTLDSNLCLSYSWNRGQLVLQHPSVSQTALLLPAWQAHSPAQSRELHLLQSKGKIQNKGSFSGGKE